MYVFYDSYNCSSAYEWRFYSSQCFSTLFAVPDHLSQADQPPSHMAPFRFPGASLPCVTPTSLFPNSINNFRPPADRLAQASEVALQTR